MAASGQIYNETTWSFVYYEQNEEESKKNRIFDEITKQTSEKKNTLEQQREECVRASLPFALPFRSLHRNM